MVGRELPPTSRAAGLPSARVGCRVGRAWPRRPGCDPPRDRPRDAIAHSRGRSGSYGDTPRNRATTENLMLPTRPQQSAAPNPAVPALSLPFVSALRLPRSVAGAALRLSNLSRLHKRAVGGHMSLLAAARPDSCAAPATIGCGKRPGLRASRWYSRSQHTIVDCTRRCC